MCSHSGESNRLLILANFGPGWWNELQAPTGSPLTSGSFFCGPTDSKYEFDWELHQAVLLRTMTKFCPFVRSKLSLQTDTHNSNFGNQVLEASLRLINKLAWNFVKCQRTANVFFRFFRFFLNRFLNRCHTDFEHITELIKPVFEANRQKSRFGLQTEPQTEPNRQTGKPSPPLASGGAWAVFVSALQFVTILSCRTQNIR